MSFVFPHIVGMLYQMYLIITKPPDTSGHYQTGAIPTPVLLFAQNIFPWERERPPRLWKDYICPTLSPPPPLLVEVLWCSYI